MEQFKIIAGMEKYEVSNMGNIRRVGKDKNLTLQINSQTGYVQVNIYGKTINVHRLVAETWIPNPHNKPLTNHLNEIKTDNRAENLEWATHQENIRYSWKSGLIKTKNVEYIDNDDLVGKVIESKKYGKYTVDRIYKRIGTVWYFVVKFENTGNEKIVTKTQIQNNKMGDYNYTIRTNNKVIVNPTTEQLEEVINSYDLKISYIRVILSREGKYDKNGLTITKTLNYKVGE